MYQNQLLNRTMNTIGLFIIILLLNQTCYGEDTMQPLYRLNRAVMPKLEPEIYSTKDKEILGLLDYPMDNAVATNMLGNAVTLIRFNDDKVKLKTVAKNFKDYVGGGHTVYLPVFSEDTIGYSQNRGFTLLNLNTKKCNYYSIAGSTNLLITFVKVIDAGKHIFLFGIDYIASKTPTQILRIMDLSTEHGKIINEKMIGGNWGITVSSEAIFLHDQNIIKAMDFNFNEIDHPLVELCHKNKSKIEGEIIQLLMHPYLPVAVISDHNYDTNQRQVWSITWRDDDKQKDESSMVKVSSAGGFFKFTADGKWVIFRDFDFYYMMPVDPKLPHFFAPPILLGEVPSFPDNVTAMTRNPTGFVVAKRVRNGRKKEGTLLKWDFTEADKFLEKTGNTQ